MVSISRPKFLSSDYAYMKNGKAFYDGDAPEEIKKQVREYNEAAKKRIDNYGKRIENVSKKTSI
jgi:hypothetical protein